MNKTQMLKSSLLEKAKAISVLVVVISFATMLFSSYSERKKQVKTSDYVESSRFVNSGIGAAEAGDLDAAISLYGQAILKYADNSSAYQFMGYAQYLKFFKNKTDKAALNLAVTNLQRAVEMDPGNKWAHYNYSIVLWAAGDRDKAVSEIKSLLLLDPTFKKNIKRDGQFKPFYSSDEFKLMVNN
jgi:tetratricopeptide (TPR) repeat protein